MATEDELTEWIRDYARLVSEHQASDTKEPITQRSVFVQLHKEILLYFCWPETIKTIATANPELARASIAVLQSAGFVVDDKDVERATLHIDIGASVGTADKETLMQSERNRRAEELKTRVEETFAQLIAVRDGDDKALAEDTAELWRKTGDALDAARPGVTHDARQHYDPRIGRGGQNFFRR